MHKAGTDTFYLYGGPGTLEGKFQDASGTVPDAQGWIGVDRTDLDPHWQVSTFNASNLASHGAGNHAAWAGRSDLQEPGWITAPGYGNSWDDPLVFRSGPISNPSVGQTVQLDFFFNHNVEPNFDAFSVEYQTASGWFTVLSVDGTNGDGAGFYSAPGVQYSTLPTAPITYVGGDYAGPGGDEIVLRLRVLSDGSYSDEDGLYETDAGAVQVDDITVTWSDGTDFETFESGGFNGRWQPGKSNFVGDFAQVWPQLGSPDLDVCHQNSTPAWGFIDAGQVVGNAASAAAIPGYPTSTGGSHPVGWPLPGGPDWVVNYTGGLNGVAGGEPLYLDNEIWSPVIDWDLPGTADDGVDIAGAVLRYSVWFNLPFNNGIAATWSVRTSWNGADWGPWLNRGNVYLNPTSSPTPRWQSFEFDISDLVAGAPKIQIALGVEDLNYLWYFNSPDATRSPFYDDVALLKYRVAGPVITADADDLAHDAFPGSGSIVAMTASDRDGLDVRFDSARDIASRSNPNIDLGDSIVVNVTERIMGSQLSDLRMVWRLDKNPVFEDAIRAIPSRPEDQNLVASSTNWQGEVLATPVDSLTPGAPYFFDLPDQDFLYPGDELRYFVRAQDDAGRVTTLPADTTGFADGVGYDPQFLVRALPSISDSTGTQPTLLMWIDTGHGPEEQPLLAALGSTFQGPLPYFNTPFDLYTSMALNGLESAGGPGATLAQLANYTTIFYFGGTGGRFSLGDGNGTNGRQKSNDLQLLTDWQALSGQRNLILFGNHVVDGIQSLGAAGTTFLQSSLGVSLFVNDIGFGVPGNSSPEVAPSPLIASNPFSAHYFLMDGCPGLPTFDYLQAVSGAIVPHEFLLPSGSNSGVPASVLYDRVAGNGDRKVSMTFPYYLTSIATAPAKSIGNNAPQDVLLAEILQFLGTCCYVWDDVPAPPTRVITMDISPNPFNPSTNIHFEGVGPGMFGRVRVYNLKGELVSEIHHGPMTSRDLLWDGTDWQGHAVASGVYLVRASVDGWSQTEKVALLK